MFKVMDRHNRTSKIINFPGGVKCDVILCSNCNNLVGYYSKKKNVNNCSWICCIGRDRVGEDADFIKELTYKSYTEKLDKDHNLNGFVTKNKVQKPFCGEKDEKGNINNIETLELNDNIPKIMKNMSTQVSNQEIRVSGLEYSQILIPTSIIKDIVIKDRDNIINTEVEDFNSTKVTETNFCKTDQDISIKNNFDMDSETSNAEKNEKKFENILEKNLNEIDDLPENSEKKLEDVDRESHQ